jgi:hypothetical protein
VNELNHRSFAARLGVLMNSNGGFYQHGKSYCMDTKLFVATKYLAGAESCPVRQVPTQEPREDLGVPQSHCKDKPGAAEVRR